MKLGRISASLLAVGLLTGAPSPTRAEDIILKDGQKIVGTIIGYENDMFRVKTDYGIALVRKDKIASIQLTKLEASKPDATKRVAQSCSVVWNYSAAYVFSQHAKIPITNLRTAE